MIAILQRVNSSKVIINNKTYSKINKGLLVLLGIDKNDNKIDIDYLINKILHLRIFNDLNKKMNLSILDIKGEILIVSQFTLIGDTKKGRRPSFINAAPPQLARKLYNTFIDELKSYNNLVVQHGEFGANMDIELINHGPVTFTLDSKN